MRPAPVVALLLGSLATASPLPGQTRAFTVSTLSPVAEVTVAWRASRRPHQVELRGFRPEADPILAVMRGNTQVASASAAGGALTLSVPAAAGGEHTIVVRSRSSAAVESGELWIDGRLHSADLRFSSGAQVPLGGLSSSEEIVAVRPPNGTTSHLAYLLSADGRTVLHRAAGSHSRLRAPSAGEAIAVYATRPGSDTGSVRVYRNDAASDTDGDGLGDALEAAVGTCGSASGSVAGAECGDIADPRDTDGDGLQDGWELLGYDAAWHRPDGVLVRRHLPLPTWGSDPRHKDVFVEVDFRRLTLEDNQNGVAQRMTPAAARAFAAIFGDSATKDGVLRALHAVSVDNPDRRPGISIHLDTGVAPERPEDATIYGDWGGYTAVDAVPDGAGGYEPQTPGIWREQMSPGRHGIFHYVLGYGSGGGSCGFGIACGFNFLAPAAAAHEFGHTLGLDHNGPYGTHEPNCKPNYPSLMNYAYLGSGLMEFSDGRKFPALNNHALTETGAVDPKYGGLLRVLASTYRYRVDSATGSVDWNRDNRFAPAGTTVRAYANLRPGDGGGCEFTREGEQQTGMMSRRSPAIVRYRDHLWVFTIALDGKLAFTYTPTPFTCAEVDRCPPLAFVTPGTRDLGPVEGIDAATIVVSGRPLILIAGIRPDGTLFETWIEEVNGRFVWGAVVPIPSSPAGGEPSLAVDGKGARVVLAYRGRDNVVRYRFRSSAAFQAERTVMSGGRPLVMSAEGSPALAFTWLPIGTTALPREHLLGAFIDTTSTVQLYAPAEFGRGWTRIGIPYGPMRKAAGRPALAWAGPTPGATVATPGAVGGSPLGRRPRPDAAVRFDRPAAADGTPAAAAGAAIQPETYGRLYVLYIENAPPAGDATDPDPVRMEMSYVDADGRLRIGLDSFFDNVWSFAFGVDLLQPGELALRAAESYAIPNAPNHPNSLHQVTVRPHADGISDLPYANYDDWKVLGWGSCETVNAVRPTSQRITCAPRSW